MRPSHLAGLALSASLLAPSLLSGQPIAPVGGEIVIPSPGEAAPGPPKVAMAPDGSFLVVWAQGPEVSTIPASAIRARRFDRDGNPLGADFEVSSQPSVLQTSPDVARQPNGRFLVVWDSRDADGHEAIRGRALGPDATPAGPEFVVGTATYGYPENPTIAASETTGNFVVVWNSGGGGYNYVDGRSFLPDATPRGNQFKISSERGGAAAVDIAPGGNFVVAWRNFGGTAPTGPPPGLVAWRFSASGTPAGSPVQIATDFTDKPDLLLNADGSVNVIWSNSVGKPVAQRFTGADLTPASVVIELSDSEGTFGTRLTEVGDDQFAVWSEPDGPFGPPRDVFGRSLTPDLQLVGEPFRINTATDFAQASPALAGNDAGRLAVVWTHQFEQNGALANTLRGQLLQAQTTCTAGMNRLCLNGGRFAVEALWRTRLGTAGAATAVPLTDETGYFTFFNQNNVELVVKVLDACVPPFHRYWVFAAGLTNVEVDLTVIDTDTGEVATYKNPQSTPFQPILDTAAFATCP